MRSWARIDGVVGAFRRHNVVAPDLALNAPRSRADRATIVSRSWFFVKHDPSSDGDLTVDRDPASDEDRAFQIAPRVATVSQSHDGEMTVR